MKVVCCFLCIVFTLFSTTVFAAECPLTSSCLLEFSGLYEAETPADLSQGVILTKGDIFTLVLETEPPADEIPVDSGSGLFYHIKISSEFQVNGVPKFKSFDSGGTIATGPFPPPSLQEIFHGFDDGQTHFVAIVNQMINETDGTFSFSDEIFANGNIAFFSSAEHHFLALNQVNVGLIPEPSSTLLLLCGIALTIGLGRKTITLS